MSNFAGPAVAGPRVWGQVTAHIVNNVVAFQPLGRPRGGLGNAYGVFVADGARALVEHNLFAAIPPRRKPPLAVWTVASPGAMRVPGSVEAFVRLRENQVTDGAVATPSHPQDVPDPPYIYKTYALERLSLERAIECLSERSGRTGASDWSEKLCSP